MDAHVYYNTFITKKIMDLSIIYFQVWWVLTGSNRRPSVRQTDALPAELNTHGILLRDIIYLITLNHYTYIENKIKDIF